MIDITIRKGGYLLYEDLTINGTIFIYRRKVNLITKDLLR